MIKENAELAKQLEDLEHQVGSLQKSKFHIEKQMDAAKRALEEEIRGKASVSTYRSVLIRERTGCLRFLDSQIRNLTADLEQTREQLEEEQDGRSELQRQVTKLTGKV